LRKLQHGGGGEHLVHRANSETSIHAVGNLVLAVGHAVRAGKNQLAALGNRNGPRKAVLARTMLEIGLQCRDSVLLAQPRG
jgi:hypothetical protein